MNGDLTDVYVPVSLPGLEVLDNHAATTYVNVADRQMWLNKGMAGTPLVSGRENRACLSSSQKG